MRYEFHPEALAEYGHAARYYTDCQECLELRSMAAVEHAIHQILDAPERWRILEEDIRRCLTRVFPYAVLYTVSCGSTDNTSYPFRTTTSGPYDVQGHQLPRGRDAEDVQGAVK
jgi:toxin ParE1/3/4